METLFTSMQDLFANSPAMVSAFGIGLVGLACILLILLIIFFFRIYIAYWMAKRRHRDPLAWALLSFFVSPIMTWILLLLLGDAD